ncbi:MAG: alpha/beta hydrolase family protein, partial [Granulosicoccus sp.]
MKYNVSSTIIASSLAFMSLSLEAAGFRQLTIKESGQPDLAVGLWYPSEQTPPTEPNTRFGLSVALDAPISSTNGGLILISHGYGGWYAGHADTAAALADAGFMVAAPTHSGNTWSDMSSPIEKWALDRPRHMSAVLDHILSDAELQTHVDSQKVGVYGFSAGGFTALGLIGGVPDLNYAQQHCQQQPEEFVCTEGMIEQMRAANMHSLPDSAWGFDSRVKAASISAPGLGFTYTESTLARVSADVQLWSGQLDESVPTQSNAASIAAKLPSGAETHWIDKANHFAFMVVNCREAFKENDPEEYEVVCGDAKGFDRHQFH